MAWRGCGPGRAAGVRAKSRRVKERAVISATLRKPKAATHWSARRLAKEVGLSSATVHRIWQKYGLQPHRVETFKFSTDPDFDTKLADVVGLYLHPPERALVLCVDEKSQIQALNRTQPALPMWPGLPARMTHDYLRHGTTSLFAALEVASGKVHGRCFKRHTHLEFIAFLESLARRYPRLELHLICDNYGTHKHPTVKPWLAAHPRFHLHFTPTSASWLNLVERWFALTFGIDVPFKYLWCGPKIERHDQRGFLRTSRPWHRLAANLEYWISATDVFPSEDPRSALQQDGPIGEQLLEFAHLLFGQRR